MFVLFDTCFKKIIQDLIPCSRGLLWEIYKLLFDCCLTNWIFDLGTTPVFRFYFFTMDTVVYPYLAAVFYKSWYAHLPSHLKRVMVKLLATAVPGWVLSFSPWQSCWSVICTCTGWRSSKTEPEKHSFSLLSTKDYSTCWINVDAISWHLGK